MNPENYVLTCPHCSSTPTPFSPEGAIVRATAPGGTERMWRLGICPACGGAVAFESDPRHDVFVQSVPKAAGSEWEVGHLPEEIERDWQEAVQVHRVGAHASAVVACGRTLEASADELGVEGGSLAKRLDQMLEQGLITNRFHDAMGYARLIRNTGAHAGQAVSPESADGTMRFTLQALRLLFEVPGELDRLQGRPPELAAENGEPEGDAG